MKKDYFKFHISEAGKRLCGTMDKHYPRKKSISKSQAKKANLKNCCPACRKIFEEGIVK